MDFTWWQVLILIVVAAIVLPTALPITITRTVKALNDLKTKINVGAVKIDPTASTVVSSCHIGECKNIDMVIRETMRTSDRVNEIKYKQIPDMQMSYVEERVGICISQFEALFLEMLSEKRAQHGTTDDGNLSKTNDFIKYKNLLGLWEDEVRSIFRLSFNQNNFRKFSDSDFDTMIDRKSSYMVAGYTHLVNSRYPSDCLITSADAADILQTMLPVFEDFVHNVFTHARAIKREKEDEIAQIENELTVFIQNLNRLPQGAH